MKKNNVITIIKFILIIGALIGMVVCAVSSLIFWLQNPDMTDLRRLIEFPEPTIGVMICFVVFGIGMYLRD